MQVQFAGMQMGLLKHIPIDNGDGDVANILNVFLGVSAGVLSKSLIHRTSLS